MKNELKVTITPALVTANFEDLKTSLKVEVAKYKTVVTEDTVAEARKLATELNAVTKGINVVKKEQLAILNAPASVFTAQIAELNKIVQDGREDITKQVKVFEEEKLKKIKTQIEDLLVKEIDIQQLAEGNDPIIVSDLILLGSATKTGNLTGKVQKEVEARVASAKAKEREIEMRLLQLDNECYKAGLKVPLSAEYIKEFLKVDEETYKARLAHLISLELVRQEEAEEKTKAEAQRLIDKANKQKEVAQEELKEIKEAPAEIPETVAEPKKDTTPIAEAPEGKKTLRIALGFDIIVREGATEDKVIAKMRQLLENAGIPQLNHIRVENG